MWLRSCLKMIFRWFRLVSTRYFTTMSFKWPPPIGSILISKHGNNTHLHTHGRGMAIPNRLSPEYQGWFMDDKNQRHIPICEKASGPNYDWTPSRGGRDYLPGYKTMTFKEAAEYCSKNEGRILEPIDEHDIVVIMEFMVEVGLEKIWLGISTDIDGPK